MAWVIPQSRQQNADNGESHVVILMKPLLPSPPVYIWYKKLWKINADDIWISPETPSWYCPVVCVFIFPCLCLYPGKKWFLLRLFLNTFFLPVPFLSSEMYFIVWIFDQENLSITWSFINISTWCHLTDWIIPYIVIFHFAFLTEFKTKTVF